MDAHSAGTALFGIELRRRRVAAGLSLTDLQRLVHYSRSHLSKVETGAKRPSQDLARRCDAALCCDGVLAALVPAPPSEATALERDDWGEVWVLRLDHDGESGFSALSRRSLLAGGLAGLALPHGAESAPGGRRAAGFTPRADPESVAAFAAVFAELRGLGQRLGPAVLIPTLASNTHALRSIALSSRPAHRSAALVLAARFAEYTGWMAQEAGDDAQAAWWTDRAVDMAAQGGDAEMQSYALVRRGLIALYRHDARSTVALAEQAGERAHTARIRGLAAQREAQGHALSGEYDACLRALDRAAALLDVREAQDGGERIGGRELIIGTSSVPDPVAAATGWCLFDLGYPERAVRVLSQELDRIAPTAYRARARFGARLALALAASGEPVEACAVADSVVEACDRVDSATVRSDLRALSRTLNRWHARPEVRETRLRLTAALHDAP